MKRYLFVDSYDGQVFGFIESDSTYAEIQKEIYAIKNSMTIKELESYTVENIIEKLIDKGYNVSYIQFDGQAIEA